MKRYGRSSKRVSVVMVLVLMPFVVTSTWAARLPGDTEAEMAGHQEAIDPLTRETEREPADFPIRQYDWIVLPKIDSKSDLDGNSGNATWIAAELPTLSNAGSGKGAATTATRSVKLPERLSAAELKRMMMDLPGTFAIVDLRPPAHFADFSLPGSKNAAIADVIADPAYLAGTDPLVIVDRDGTLAMAVGGILSQKTQRTIKVLFGGLEAYWNESGALSPPASPSSIAFPGVKPPSPAPGPAMPAAPAPAAPESPKKKSAGC